MFIHINTVCFDSAKDVLYLCLFSSHPTFLKKIYSQIWGLNRILLGSLGHEDIRIDVCIAWIRTWSVISVENMAFRCYHIRFILTFHLVV